MTPAKGQFNTINETTNLGIGFLVAESEAGDYQPVSAVSTISEAREMVAHDLRLRMQMLKEGSDPICPARYLVWARGNAGDYQVAATITA